VGIASDNTIYFTATQPESGTVDTAVYLPFNVHYGEISPYTGAISYGGNITGLPLGDTMNAIYPHTSYIVPLGGEVPSGTHGPGVTWSQMVNALPPSDIFYYHGDSLAGITEEEGKTDQKPVMLYQNYPNPVNSKTMIRFTVPRNTAITLDVYDISGRLVRRLAGGIPGAGSYFVVWDGTDSNGLAVPGGVYLYTLKAGPYTETRKLILVR
jgi:hypothetical protein